MSVSVRPLAEVTQEAIRILSREMGVADTMRFLGQFAAGAGNYTEERDALFGNLTLEEILAQVTNGESRDR
ncbi:MAG TPA: hypothetical protein VJT67_17605 [Longimicrobiaceae bacterium]|nr:hypothetical protein [Longimicrobiaceae bacterium]